MLFGFLLWVWVFWGFLVFALGLFFFVFVLGFLFLLLGEVGMVFIC